MIARAPYFFAAPGLNHREPVWLYCMAETTSSFTSHPLACYELGELIGRGRTCSVFKVASRNGDPPEVPAVIKVYRHNIVEPDEYFDEWRAEIKWLTDLACPNIPRILDAPTFSWLEGGLLKCHFCVVMANAGVAVSSLIKAGPIAESMAKLIAADVCRALVSIHKAGLIHSDVKPGNIFWNGTTTVLGDLATIVDPKDEDDYATGTVPYWSPEYMYSDAREKGIDIWALGVTYFEMVTGDLLFDTYADSNTLYGGGLDSLGIPSITEDTCESTVDGHNDTTDELTHFRMTLLFHRILGPPPENLLEVMSGFFTAAGDPHFAIGQEPVNLVEYLKSWQDHNAENTARILLALLDWDPAKRPSAGQARKVITRPAKK